MDANARYIFEQQHPRFRLVNDLWTNPVNDQAFVEQGLEVEGTYEWVRCT